MENDNTRRERCSNSEAGWFNQECGRPATWLGYKEGRPYDGLYGWGYCDRCKEHGREARDVVRWEKIERPVVATRSKGGSIWPRDAMNTRS
jgi:hypothetical protein